MTETWHDKIVTVLSNAVSGNGMTNTPGHFKVRLPSPITLQCMEVGVRNITFPTSWNPAPLKDRHHHAPRWVVTLCYDGSRGPFPSKAPANTGPLAQWVVDTHHNAMLFTLENVPTKTTHVVTQMIRQVNETMPNKDIGLMCAAVPINASSPRRVIIRNRTRATTTLWGNKTLCTLLNYGRDPNDELPVRYLVTEGSKRGQVLKLSDISTSQQRLTTPFKRISNKSKVK